MSVLKTQPSNEDVMHFLDGIENEIRKKECLQLLKIFKELTSLEPRIWGDSMVGFGSYHYKYKSGREGNWFLTGFSPRKQNLTIYIMSGFNDFQEQLGRIGKHKTSSSCLYINKLENIDLTILKEIIAESVLKMKQNYPDS